MSIRKNPFQLASKSKIVDPSEFGVEKSLFQRGEKKSEDGPTKKTDGGRDQEISDNDNEPDEELEFFIDLILQSNFGQIKKEDLVNSLKELEAKAAAAATQAKGSKAAPKVVKGTKFTKVAKPDHVAKPVKVEKITKIPQPEKTHKPEKVEKIEKTDRTAQTQSQAQGRSASKKVANPEAREKVAKVTPPPPKERKEFQLSGLILEKMREYDALRDDHLKEFLSTGNRRQILVRTGLLTKDGYIVNNATVQFKQNREAQKMKHGATNSKSDTEQIKFKEEKYVSPYYNRSWENKDKLYKKLYGNKKQTTKAGETQNETTPKMEEGSAPKKSIMEKRESKAGEPKPLEPKDTNRSDIDPKADGDGGLAEPEEAMEAEGEGDHEPRTDGEAEPHLQEEYDEFEDEVEENEEADQVAPVPESPHAASDVPAKFTLESEISVDT